MAKMISRNLLLPFSKVFVLLALVLLFLTDSLFGINRILPRVILPTLPLPEPISTPSALIQMTPTPKKVKPTSPPTPTQEWGVAKQIGEHTWTMNVAMDDRMATPDEIFRALNNYRTSKGRSQLSWDVKLAQYAQNRADHFTAIKGTDSHKGFEEYLKDENNFRVLGFAALGENSSYGYRLYGVHLIEWIFAGDAPHDNNQLSDWGYVGIGVNNTSVDIIFGKDHI